MNLLQRLRNIWIWGEYNPNLYPRFKEGENGVPELTDRGRQELNQFQKAQIIYPNKRAELVKAKPDLSLDELLSEK